MNPYTTMGQSRIRQSDIATILRADRFLAAAALAALERQRSWQAEAEMERLLRQHHVTPRVAFSLGPRLRQRLGTALIRMGTGLAGGPLPNTAPQPTS